MIRFILVFFLLLLAYAATVPDKSSKLGQESRLVRLIKVVDGDTLIVKDGSEVLRVRLIGIDAPEASQNIKARYDSYQSGIKLKRIVAGGLLSFKHLTKLLKNQNQIRLQTDSAHYDKYKRTLVYVFRQDNLFINLKMLEDGYAKAYDSGVNHKFQSELTAASRKAKLDKVGLWSGKFRSF